MVTKSFNTQLGGQEKDQQTQVYFRPKPCHQPCISSKQYLRLLPAVVSVRRYCRIRLDWRLLAKAEEMLNRNLIKQTLFEKLCMEQCTLHMEALFLLLVQCPNNRNVHTFTGYCTCLFKCFIYGSFRSIRIFMSSERK